MAGRLFKVKMRPGRALLGLINDGTEPPRAGPAEEVLVDEHTATFLVRNRAAEVIEVVESSEHGQEAS